MDDVERYVGTALNFSLAAFDATLPHFLRLAVSRRNLSSPMEAEPFLPPLAYIQWQLGGLYNARNPIPQRDLGGPSCWQFDLI